MRTLDFLRENVPAKQFALDNAGRYYEFTHRGKKVYRVRVVGYHKDNYVIVTYQRGWRFIDPEIDKFVIKTKAKRFWYVFVDSLKEIHL